MTTSTTTRRPFIRGLLGAGLAAAVPHLARAQAFPARPVRVVVNFPPGGPLDILARLLAAQLQAALKQPFSVENVTGAAGAIGAAAVARAPADGHTLLMTIDAPFTSSVALNPKTAPNLDDFTPVMTMGQTGLALAVHPSLGVRTLAEFVEAGRKSPITFSTAGIGSPGHFAALMLAEATNIQATSVAYRGNAPAITALLSGEVQAGFLGIPGLMPHIQGGKLQGLMVAGQQSPLLPQLPTTASAGYPALAMASYFVTMAPAKTSEPVVATLQAAIAEIMARPAVKEQLQKLDIATQTLDAAQTRALLARLQAQYQTTVQAHGIKPE